MSRIFGPMRQNGYVVRDIEAAMRHWSEVAGVGPFFFVRKVPIENFHFMGEPSDIELSIALANSGPLQIELIEQRNDAPSMYRDFLAARGEGLQHVAYWTETFDADLARANDRGFQVAQSGNIGADGRFVYFSKEAHPGTVIELSEISGEKGKLFQFIRDSAETWDGNDPVRRF